MAEQPTIAGVLALHVIIDRKSRFSGAVWCSCGFRTEFTGRVYDEYRGHVAQELTNAGFGNQHDAWAEGQKSGMRHADRVIAAHKIGRPDLPGPPNPNPYT